MDKTKLKCPKCGFEFETSKIDPEDFGASGLSKKRPSVPAVEFIPEWSEEETRFY